MDDLIEKLLTLLGGINPLFALLALVVYILFGDKIKLLLARLRVWLTPAPVEPGDPSDPDVWLEENPLLDRLWKILKEKFKDKVLNGEVSEDDLYVALVKAVKDAKADGEDE